MQKTDGEKLLQARQLVCQSPPVKVTRCDPKVFPQNPKFVSFRVTSLYGKDCSLEGVPNWSRFLYTDASTWARLRLVAPGMYRNPSVHIVATGPDEICFGEMFRFRLIQPNQIPTLQITGMHSGHRLNCRHFLTKDC